MSGLNTKSIERKEGAAAAAKMTKTSAVITATTSTKSKDQKATMSNEKQSGEVDDSCTAVKQNNDNGVLIVIRILYLSLYASFGCLQPFLPVYYHSLGHGGLIIGILGAIRPLTTFLVSPLWGIASDKTNPTFILKITCLVSTMTQLGIPFRNDAVYLLGLVLLKSIFIAPIKSLVDSTVMKHLTTMSQKDNYGRFRLFGTLGFGLGISLSGMLLNITSKDGLEVSDTSTVSSKSTNMLMNLFSTYKVTLMEFIDQYLHGYRLAFGLYGILCIPVFCCLQYLGNSEKKKTIKEQEVGPNNNNSNTTGATQQQKTQETIDSNKAATTKKTTIKEGFYILIQNQDAILFFFLIFIAGINGGCSENFSYVRMREVGGTTSQIGFGRLLGSTCGAIMFWIAGPITQWLGGATPILTMTPILYGMRFCILGCMTQPYQMYPAEVLRNVTFAIYWSTATTYAHQISPEGMNSTMLMFLNAIYGGLGPSFGSIIFGKFQTIIGTAQSFLGLAILDVCVSSGVGLFLLTQRIKKDKTKNKHVSTTAHNSNKVKEL